MNEWANKTWGECIDTFAKNTLFSTPKLIMLFLLIALGLGLFTSLIEIKKFDLFCDLFKIALPTYAAAGVYKKIKDNGNKK